jgi:uncharacterized membrane protein
VLPLTKELRTTLQALFVGVTIYVVLRFVVPQSLDSNLRSAIGAVVAFVASMIVSRVLVRNMP